MPISDPRDRFFYPHHTHMKHTYNLPGNSFIGPAGRIKTLMTQIYQTCTLLLRQSKILYLYDKDTYVITPEPDVYDTCTFPLDASYLNEVFPISASPICSDCVLSALRTQTYSFEIRKICDKLFQSIYFLYLSF